MLPTTFPGRARRRRLLTSRELFSTGNVYSVENARREQVRPARRWSIALAERPRTGTGGWEGDAMTLKRGPNWLKRGSNWLKTAPNRVMFCGKCSHIRRNPFPDKDLALCHSHDTSKASFHKELRPKKSSNRRDNGQKYLSEQELRRCRKTKRKMESITNSNPSVLDLLTVFRPDDQQSFRRFADFNPGDDLSGGRVDDRDGIADALGNVAELAIGREADPVTASLHLDGRDSVSAAQQ